MNKPPKQPPFPIPLNSPVEMGFDSKMRPYMHIESAQLLAEQLATAAIAETYWRRIADGTDSWKGELDGKSVNLLALDNADACRAYADKLIRKEAK